MARSYRASIEGNVKLGSRGDVGELGEVEEEKRDPRNDKSAIESREIGGICQTRGFLDAYFQVSNHYLHY
jgi:hypothetical protein